MNIRSNFHLRVLFLASVLFYNYNTHAQVKWRNVNAAYAPLPIDFNVYKTTDSLDGKPFVAYYAIAGLKNKQLQFSADTSSKRRLTPRQFYEKNAHPLLVVNTTFFSFATNQNLNVVIKDGRLVSHNIHFIPGRGKDTLTYRHPLNGALGISKKRVADVAWIYTDSAKKFAYALQSAALPFRDSFVHAKPQQKRWSREQGNQPLPGENFKKWKMQTAVGGGPVLVQHGQVQVSNNEELKFAGKAINDLHPRTLMGYTKDNHLIIMVIEGRNPGVASGASLLQAAQLMVEVGCTEALNLDGGGSSCMLINGRETIYPSDKGLQRAVPAVLMIH